MRLPTALRRMDDRVLGDRLRRRPQTEGAVADTAASARPATDRGPRLPRSGTGARQALTVVYRVSRLVFLLLALAVALGVVFVLAPTNADNVIVRNVAEIARDAAGPFRDVFTVADDPEREVVVNYSVAAVVYLVAASLVRRLPGGKGS